MIHRVEQDGLAWAIAGHIHLENGRHEEAKTALRKAVERSPELPSVWFSLHLALFDERDQGAAIEAAARAVALAPTNLWYRWCLGALRGLAADLAGARSDFARLEVEQGAYRGAIDAYNYVLAHRTPATRFFATTCDLLLFALDAARPDGLVTEFGVRHGASIRWIASRAGGPVHGFDSFEGLPEKWHIQETGAYSTRNQLPKVPANVKLHVGWFADTLPPFAASNPAPIRFANVDCDLYSSTATVFDALGDRIEPGTVIVFDEYIVNDRWREDEFKAFQEAVAKHGWHYEYLAFSFVTMQAAVRIL